MVSDIYLYVNLLLTDMWRIRAEIYEDISIITALLCRK